MQFSLQVLVFVVIPVLLVRQRLRHATELPLRQGNARLVVL